MTSKEALELAILEFSKDLEEDTNNQWLKNVLQGLKETKKELERLEKLSIEIDDLLDDKIELVVKNKQQDMLIGKLIQENEKLKQVIDIIKDKFKFELGVSVVKEKYCYSLEFLFNNQYFSITKEEYELLKEVLK